MHEARIIMPSNGRGTPHSTNRRAHEVIEGQLAAAFGGYTVSTGNGGWIDNDGNLIRDAVRVYDVAINTREIEGADAALCNIAVTAGRALNQQCVYVRMTNGQVILIDIPKEWAETSPEVSTEEVGPLGRKIEVGDLWKTIDGSIIAITSRSNARLVRCMVLTLANGATLDHVYQIYIDATDGMYHIAPSKKAHPLDLEKFVGRYV